MSVLDIDPRVGREIVGLRKAKGLTISDLSEMTGLSRGYISQVEQGKSKPSIKALHSIGRAMNVTVSWFFPEQDPNDDPALGNMVVRNGNRRELSFECGITDQLLSPSLNGKLEMLRCVFEPHSGSGPEPYTHKGEEAGIVISGCLHLWVDGKHIVLNEGDSFSFSSELPHRYENPTDSESIVIWAMTPPSY